MDPAESRVQQFFPPRTRALTIRSDMTYKSFREKRFITLQAAASRMIAVWARQTWEEVRGKDTLLPSTFFFPQALQKRLSEKIHLITSVDRLCKVLCNWQQLDSQKFRLFRFCKEMLKGLDDIRQMAEDDEMVEDDEVSEDGGVLKDDEMAENDEMVVEDEVGDDEQKMQAVHQLKILIPTSKHGAHKEDPIGERPQKRQCRGIGK